MRREEKEILLGVEMKQNTQTCHFSPQNCLPIDSVSFEQLVSLMLISALSPQEISFKTLFYYKIRTLGDEVIVSTGLEDTGYS